MDIERVKERIKNEYESLTTNYEAYHFNRGFIWGTSFRSTKEERKILYDLNEKLIHEKKEWGEGG